MMKMKVKIALHGCDDSTYIEDVEVTEEQLTLLKMIAARSEDVSHYGCMPIMEIEMQGDDDL
jgi:hypothetical protein